MATDKAAKAAIARDKKRAQDRADEEAKQAKIQQAVFDVTHDKDGDPIPIEAPES